MYTKLYLLKSKGQIRKDGTTEIKIYYKHKDKNPVYFNTKIYVQPSQLSDKGIINHPDSRELNISLAKVKNTYDNIIIKFIGGHCRKPSATELREYVSSEHIQDQLKFFQNTYQRANFNQIRLENGDIYETGGDVFEVDLLDLEKLKVEATQNTKMLAEREADRKKRWLIQDFNKYLEQATIKAGTKKIYEQTVKHLEAFIKSHPVSSYKDINLPFFQEFLLYLHHIPTRYNANMVDNTIINHLRNLNAFLNYQSGYISEAHPCNLKRFRLNDDTYNLHLTDEELTKLISCNIQNLVDQKGKPLGNAIKHSLEFVQDIITLNSFLGLRIEDLFNIPRYNIIARSEGKYRLRVTEAKTERLNDTPREVPVLDPVPIAIINKLLSAETKFPFRRMKIDAFNKRMKQLGKYANLDRRVKKSSKSLNITNTSEYYIYELISSHCLRRFAITNNIKEYGYTAAKSLSNHRTEKAFNRYTRTFSGDELEEMMIRKEKK